MDSSMVLLQGVRLTHTNAKGALYLLLIYVYIYIYIETQASWSQRYQKISSNIWHILLDIFLISVAVVSAASCLTNAKLG